MMFGASAEYLTKLSNSIRMSALGFGTLILLQCLLPGADVVSIRRNMPGDDGDLLNLPSTRSPSPDVLDPIPNPAKKGKPLARCNAQMIPGLPLYQEEMVMKGIECGQVGK
jgi:hypothetical protein